MNFIGKAGIRFASKEIRFLSPTVPVVAAIVVHSSVIPVNSIPTVLNQSARGCLPILNFKDCFVKFSKHLKGL